MSLQRGLSFRAKAAPNVFQFGAGKPRNPLFDPVRYLKKTSGTLHPVQPLTGAKEALTDFSAL
jgi:hypothetical protein